MGRPSHRLADSSARRGGAGRRGPLSIAASTLGAATGASGSPSTCAGLPALDRSNSNVPAR